MMLDGVVSQLGFNVPPTTRSYGYISSERPEKWEINLAFPGLVVERVIHYTTATPVRRCNIVFSHQKKSYAMQLQSKFLAGFLFL